MKTFVIPGTLHRKQTKRSRPRMQEVSFFIEAEDREDALFQAHHGVIEATVARDYPGATMKYDIRKMKAIR